LWHIAAPMGCLRGSVDIGGKAKVPAMAESCVPDPKATLSIRQAARRRRTRRATFSLGLELWGAMRRREFITLLAGSAVGLPRATRAEADDQIRRIGILAPGGPDNPAMAQFLPEFTAELRKLGFSEGSTLIVEGRIDGGTSEAFAAAADLIRSKVDVVVAFGPEIVLKAAVKASQTIPIVMIAVNFDPVATGYVSNIARPDKNATGVVYRAPELAAKQLEILVETLPSDKRVAVLWAAASAEQFDAAQRAAHSLRIELRPHKIERQPFDFDEAFRAIANDGSRMVLVLSGPASPPNVS
jgi:putative tryptophan/tyrosine transport system substrate-binding protein